MWHYICTPVVISHDGLAGRSGCGVDAQGVVDGLLERFGAGGFAYMQSARVGASEGGGDALLSFEDPSNGVPARVLAGFAQTPSDELYELVGDDSDEQRSFGSDGFVVEDGPQSEFRFQGAEDGLKVGEGDIGPPPRPFFVLLALFASWAAGAMVWSAKHASGRQDPLRAVSASGRGRVLV